MYYEDNIILVYNTFSSSSCVTKTITQSRGKNLELTKLWHPCSILETHMVELDLFILIFSTGKIFPKHKSIKK